MDLMADPSAVQAGALRSWRPTDREETTKLLPLLRVSPGHQRSSTIALKERERNAISRKMKRFLVISTWGFSISMEFKLLHHNIPGTATNNKNNNDHISCLPLLRMSDRGSNLAFFRLFFRTSVPAQDTSQPPLPASPRLEAQDHEVSSFDVGI